MLPSSQISGQGLHPLVLSLTDLIRGWRTKLPEVMKLDVAPELLAIGGQFEGQELFISNELHRSKGFRKLHLEVAKLGAGLQVLHCVFFPDPRFDLPIFGIDLVVTSTGISAAIVDLSPAGENLPCFFQETLEKLSKPCFSDVRALPAWGSIFSPFVCFIRPVCLEEEKLFFDLVNSYLDLLISNSSITSPDSKDSAASITRYKGQMLYCLQQKRNDKTRSVLAKAFNPQWADRYIEELLFDNPLPPWT